MGGWVGSPPTLSGQEPSFPTPRASRWLSWWPREPEDRAESEGNGQEGLGSAGALWPHPQSRAEQTKALLNVACLVMRATLL